MDHKREIAKIKTLSENVTARHRQDYAYFVLAKNGLIKIGRSRNPEQRLYALRNSSEFDLDIWITIPYDDGFDLEIYLHKLFSGCRVYGEWFKLGDDEIGFVKSVFPKAVSQSPSIESEIDPRSFFGESPVYPESITMPFRGKQIIPVSKLVKTINKIWHRQNDDRIKWPLFQKRFTGWRFDLRLYEYWAIVHFLDDLDLIDVPRASGRLYLPPADTLAMIFDPPEDE